jgi:uncharacterized membrane protein
LLITTIKAYARRYRDDLKAFAKAYALSTVAALPVLVQTYGALFWLPYLFVAFLGAITIAIVAVITAIFDRYLYKLAVYLAAVAYFGSGLWVSGRVPVAGVMNETQLIFVQVVFVFGLFYFLAERSRIATRIAKVLDGDDAAQEKMIAEERATLKASRGTGR